MSEGKATVLLQHYLKQLKLPSFLREYEKLATVCQQERADYQTFLLRLAEVEMADRERRAAERRVKAARFPVLKTLDTFDFNWISFAHCLIWHGRRICTARKPNHDECVVEKLCPRVGTD